MSKAVPTAPPEAPLRTLFESDALKLTYRAGASGKLVIATTGAGNKGEALLREEFFSQLLAHGAHSCLFVIDRKRSWYTHPEIRPRVLAAIEEINAQREITSTYGLGGSMGGFGVIRMAEYTPMKTILAFAPQYSMNRLVVSDSRWREYRKGVFGYNDWGLNRHIVSRTDYRIVFGNDRRDLRHRKKFRPRQNVRIYDVPDGGHVVARTLKDRGQLQPIIDAALEDRTSDLEQELARATLADTQQQEHSQR